MAKKTIDSKVWKDNFFSVLTPKQKLLWLYLITCDFNNMLGIYEINLRIVSFDTGLSLDEINDYLALFESKGKIVVKGDYLNLVNFLKHQNYNPNMKKSALNVYQDLPDEMKIEGYDYFDDFDDMVKAFGFANKVLEVKKPNTKNELFNEFYLKYNKIGRREEALSEFNMLTKEEQQLCLKSIPKYLKTVKGVSFVAYPGLKDHPNHDIAKKQMTNGFGGVLSFGLKADHDTYNRFVSHLNVITSAVSLGHDESLIVFLGENDERQYLYPEEFHNGFFRFSVGIEDAEDIIADLEQAFKKENLL